MFRFEHGLYRLQAAIFNMDTVFYIFLDAIVFNTDAIVFILPFLMMRSSLMCHFDHGFDRFLVAIKNTDAIVFCFPFVILNTDRNVFNVLF